MACPYVVSVGVIYRVYLHHTVHRALSGPIRSCEACKGRDDSKSLVEFCGCVNLCGKCVPTPDLNLMFAAVRVTFPGQTL